MEAIGLVTGLLLVLLEDVRAEFCSGYMTYCENGCCGSTCCNNINIPVIVGSTVGGIVFIVIVIISICVYLKKSNKSDRTIGVDPNLMGAAALAAQQAGISPQMVPPFGHSAFPSPQHCYGMQPTPNPLLSYPLSANLPPPYLAPPNLTSANPAPANPAPAYHPPPNPAPANPAPAYHPPPNPAPAYHPPPNPTHANPAPPNPPPEIPAPPNPPPQQAPSPN